MSDKRPRGVTHPHRATGVRSSGRRLALVAALALLVPAPAAAVRDTSAHAASTRAAVEPVGVDDCYSTDNGDPRLVDFRYGPATVDVIDAKEEIHFRVRARDTGGPGPASGVRSVTVWFGTSGVEDLGTVGHELTQDADGWWTGSVTVPRRTPHRLWPVIGLDLRDRAGNIRNYSRPALQRLTGRPLDVSITTARDRTPPRLTAFSVAPVLVDSRQAVRYVTFTARVVDAQSDVMDDEVAVDGSGDTSWLAPDTGTIILHKVAGSHLFRAQVPVTRWVGTRTWRTTDVWAWNTAGELAFYSRRALTKLGFHGDLSVRGNSDPARPRMKSFDVTAQTLDVRHSDAEVSFHVHATDVGSGVHSIFLSTESLEARELSVYLTLTSGTPQDGIWTATAEVRRCRTHTGTWRLQLTIYDRNGTYNDSTNYDATQLAAHGWQNRILVNAGDRERPHVSVPSRIPRAGRIRMMFTEAVQGIDPANARVQPIRPNGARGQALPGSWRCVNKLEDRTNCRTGSVRKAQFRPRHPLHTGARYAVTLNPEHHLSITDLAGNPLRQSVKRLRVNQ